MSSPRSTAQTSAVMAKKKKERAIPLKTISTPRSYKSGSTMGPSSPSNGSALHGTLSDDASTLSNDSLSENSTSSLDHDVRLSSLRGGAGAGKGGGGTSKQDSNDRDMTEDEVAIMVKNALRKARRAMNNSSPVSDDDDTSGGIGGAGSGGGAPAADSPRNAKAVTSRDDEDGDDDSSTDHPKFRDALDTLSPNVSASEDADDKSGGGVNAAPSEDKSEADGGDGGESLAKRIEEEIQSARAFAEKKYYSGDKDGGGNSSSPGGSPKNGGSGSGIESPTPLSRSHGSNRSSLTVQSANTEDTPLISNMSPAGTPTGSIAELPTPRQGGTTSPVRSPGAVASFLGTASGSISPPNQPLRTPRESARERMARSKDKIAEANERLLNKDFKIKTGSTSPRGGPASPSYGRGGPASPSYGAGGSSPDEGGRPLKLSTSPNSKTSPGNAKDFDSMLAASPNIVPATVVARSPANASGNGTNSSSSFASAASTLNTSPSPEKKKKKGNASIDPTADDAPSGTEGRTSLLSPSSNVLLSGNAAATTPGSVGSGGAFSPAHNSVLNNGGGGLHRPPLSSNTSALNTNNAAPPPPPPPPNTNSNKGPQQHRQVLFRHPYPLPPPPPLPRNDAIIISSHSAPEKNINTKWVEPDSDLSQLIEAAGEEYNLVRRSNACGALKVLASKENNKPKLCRTRGLLDVLVKASWDDAVDSDALDARTRAVTTILYLSEPKDNRLIVAKHPQLLEVLVKVIQEDTGEGRWRATSALATLGKTPGNRGGMGRVDDLATVLGDLMVVGQTRKDMDPPGKEKADAKGKGGKKGNAESREDDNSFLEGGESATRGGTKSFDTMDDERMLTHTYTGTFTEGTGTTFSEDLTYQSAYDSDTHSDEEGMDGEGSLGEEGSDGEEYGSDEDGSIQEEEGVEMQISSLKKLNIENASDFLAKSQLSACATLTHLSKHCGNAPLLCRNDPLLQNIIYLAGIFDSPLHTRCLEMLCNFTRFPSNNARLASMPRCVETLLLCGKSKIGEDRMWSIRTIQNLCSDASSKVGLATGAMLSLLSTAAMRKDYEEQYAAVGALMNLSTEPGSIVPLTNTKTVVATLVHLAHSPNTPGAVRKIACDSLATIGLWLQTLASAGTVPEEIPFSPLPTHSATGWLRWEN